MHVLGNFNNWIILSVRVVTIILLYGKSCALDILKFTGIMFPNKVCIWIILYLNVC